MYTQSCHHKIYVLHSCAVGQIITMKTMTNANGKTVTTVLLMMTITFASPMGAMKIQFHVSVLIQTLQQGEGGMSSAS